MSKLFALLFMSAFLSGCAMTSNSLALMSAMLNNAAIAVNASTQVGYLASQRQSPYGYGQPAYGQQYASMPYAPYMAQPYGQQYQPQQYQYQPQYSPQYAQAGAYAGMSEAQREAALSARDVQHAAQVQQTQALAPVDTDYLDWLDGNT